MLWLAPTLELESLQGGLELLLGRLRRQPPAGALGGEPLGSFALAVRGEAEGSPRHVEQLLELMHGLSTWRAALRVCGGRASSCWPGPRSRPESGRRHGGGWPPAAAAACASCGGWRPPTWERRRPSPPCSGSTGSSPRSGAAPCPLSGPSWRGTGRAQPSPIPAPPARREGVWLRHLRLLADAGAGRPVEAREVGALADAWESALRRANHVRLLTRGAELGVPDSEAAAGALRPAILAELGDLAYAVEGDWPEPERRNGLAAQVRRRRLDRLFGAVQAEVEPFRNRDFSEFERRLETPRDEMERWLDFRLSLRRLLQASGQGALATSWHGGLRIAACNWPVFLLRTHGQTAHWACRVMFRWCEAQARAMGDEEIAKLSRGNARLVRSLFR